MLGAEDLDGAARRERRAGRVRPDPFLAPDRPLDEPDAVDGVAQRPVALDPQEAARVVGHGDDEAVVGGGVHDELAHDRHDARERVRLAVGDEVVVGEARVGAGRLRVDAAVHGPAPRVGDERVDAAREDAVVEERAVGGADGARVAARVGASRVLLGAGRRCGSARHGTSTSSCGAGASVGRAGSGASGRQPVPGGA